MVFEFTQIDCDQSPLYAEGDYVYFRGTRQWDGESIPDQMGTSPVTIRHSAGGRSTSILAGTIWSFFAGGDGVAKELWKSDGHTRRQTELLSSQVSLGTSESGFPYESSPRFVTLNSQTLFFAFDPGGRSWNLHRTDGSGNNTVAIKKSISNPWSLEVVGDWAYFISSGNLWKTDGTAVGTERVADVSGVVGGEIVASNGKLFFTRNDGLWMTDGTENGAIVLTNVAAQHLIDVNGTLYFVVDGRSTQLWKSDGTAKGTTLVSAIEPWVNRLQLIATRDTLYAYDYDLGELWVSDGTASGTHAIDTINWDGSFATLDNRLYFNADGYLWVADSNGIEQILADDTVGIDGPNNLVATNDGIFFLAGDENDDIGQYLWFSDGTVEGTNRLIEAEEYLYRTSIQVVDDELYIGISTESSGQELWRSDGTVEGTIQVADINPGVGDSEPKYMTESDGSVYFVADDGFHGRELYRVPLEPEPIPVAGDSNGDGIFNSADLIQVFQRAQYEDEIPNNSAFEDGDWNGDGEFNSSDFVFVFQKGNYVAAASRGSLEDAAMASLFNQENADRLFEKRRPIVWEVATKRFERLVERPGDSGLAYGVVAFRPDGTRAITLSDRGTIVQSINTFRKT